VSTSGDARERWTTSGQGLGLSQIFHHTEVPERSAVLPYSSRPRLDKALDNTTSWRFVSRRSRKENRSRPLCRFASSSRGSHHRRQRADPSLGKKGLPEDTIRLHFQGSAGQSFGAFMPRGMTFILEGDSTITSVKACRAARSSSIRRPDDFRAGGKRHRRERGFFTARPPERLRAGMAGRALRSPPTAASKRLEAVGDHGCEYMTGGTVSCWDRPAATSPRHVRRVAYVSMKRRLP